jgi:predicted PurR-regulated permease PerM
MTVRGQESIGRSPVAQSGVVRADGARGEADVVRQLEARVTRLEADLRGRPVGRGGSGAPLGARHVLAVLGMMAAVVGALFVGYLAWKGITLVLIAVLFALALNPAVEFFQARGCSRASAAAVVFVLALALLGLLGLLLIPPLVEQLTNFVNALPDIVANANRGHGALGVVERRFHLLENLPGAVSGANGQDVGGVATSGLGVVLGVLGTVASMVIVAFLSFFMLLEGPAWIRRLDALLPEATRPRWERIAYGIYRTVGGFVSGNLLASLLAGLTTTGVLVATGIPFAVPLGLLVAFLDLLPIFGMIIALVIMAAVSFSHSAVAGIVVVGFMFIYHQFEVYLLRPMIYGRTIELSPLAVLVAVVIGTELAGVIGALAAIPIAGAANVILCELLRARADARRQDIVEPPALRY